MIENPEDSSKTRYLCIIENDPARIERMTAALVPLNQVYTPVYLHEARAAIEWLKANITEVAFISLDYDLYRPGETMPWPGDGMDVVEWLETSLSKADHRPMVIIHSARCKTAQMMYNRLKKAGYMTVQIPPHQNDRWIEEEWVGVFSSRWSLRSALEEIEKKWPGLLEALGDE
ncbi:MAG TPA: hypothetical protein PLU72_18725 [Candidatus Ozemobacteraceae bacterium]|mgnify:CR=1 FL=1|nr:hypothetical protein [Candidatus Ozemobacteraceae bacterium]